MNTREYDIIREMDFIDTGQGHVGHIAKVARYVAHVG